MNITELPGITSHTYHVIQDSWVKEDNKQNNSSNLTENLINDKLACIIIMTETDQGTKKPFGQAEVSIY